MTKSIDATRNQCSFPTRKPPALSVLIVDDDEPLTQRLAQAMEARGFNVTIAGSVLDGCAQIQLSPPAYAVVDMRTRRWVRPGYHFSAQATTARCTRYHSDRLWQYCYRRQRSKARRRGLSGQTCGRRRHRICSAGAGGSQGRATKASHVGGSRAPGAYPARL